MRFRLGIILIIALATAAAAQEGRPQPPESRTGPSFAVNAIPVFQFPAKLDGGGEFRATRYAFPLDLSKRIDGTRDLGLSLFYDYEDYDFEGPTAIAGPAPWNTVHRIGVGIPYAQRLEGGWRLSVTPSAEFSRESGAGWGSALQYGGVVSAGKRVGDTLTLGVGAGVFYRLEEVSVFPYLVVDWRITERVRLSNPLRAGPTGPAGLELVCAVSGGWDAGFGGAYRSIRFRLDDEGVAPGGVGEVRAVPAWFRLSHRKGPFLVDAYAGAVFGGRLSVENGQGEESGSWSYDPAPFAALRIQARF
jgi:hypothetical protein